MLYCFLAPGTSGNGRKRKKPNSDEQKQQFKEKLKNSVYVERPTILGNTADPKGDDQRITDQLKEYHAAICSNSSNTTYAYCLIGRNLAALKMKHKDLVRFVQLHLPATQYSSSQIYFLIKLYNFAQTYNKLMYVTIGIGELKSKFKMVMEVIEGDSDWWKKV